jgi:hypothetical protein
MKIITKKIALLLLIIAALLSLFVVCPWLPGEPFHNIAKKHAILGNIQGKKIIFVGGSGVANGLSAAVIEKDIPGYKAVNMGLNAGLGLRFNINEVMEYVQKGDLIVLSPEYENFEGGHNGSVQILKAVNIAPFTSKYVQNDQYKYLLMHDSLTFIQLKVQSYFDRFTSIFTHASVKIDDWGDRTSESPVRDVRKMQFSLKVTPEAYSECVTILNLFDTFCRERGATALLSYPSLPRTQFRTSQQEITSLHNKLSKDTHIFILHSPSEMVFSPEYFDDTVYHLGKSGREIRSKKIANIIKLRKLNQ